MTIAGLTKHLRPYFTKVKHGNTSLAKDQGKVFIDGDCFALRLTATGHYSLRSDWGGICERVDEFMSYWRDWDIGAIMFDGQGPEIDRVASQQEVDSRMRLMSRNTFLGGRPNSVSAIVYDYLRDKYPHLNVIATASGEKDEILASTVYHYARHNRNERVFLLAKDNKYTGYHWPENVHLAKIMSLKRDWEIHILYPPRMLKRGHKLHCFELAFLCMERYSGSSRLKDVKKWLRRNDKYHKWRELQQLNLETKHKLIRPYKHIKEKTDCFEVQRALNTMRNTNTLYKQMPLMNEPFWAESAFLAGRLWRSIAYELMMNRVSYIAEDSRHFMEGRREGSTIEITKIPVCDKYREKEPHVYPLYNNMMNRLQNVTMKGLKRQIMSEIFDNTPSKNEDTRLDYEEEPYRKLVEVFMAQIWSNQKPFKRDREKLLYRDLDWDDHSMYMNPTCLRIYNKLYACVYSLIMLQSVVKMPYHFTMADLDSVQWINLWKKYVGEPSMTRKELASIEDPEYFTDQYYTYSTENVLRKELHDARKKCLQLLREGDDAGVEEAKKLVIEAEDKIVEAELDKQEQLQKAPVTARLLMTEYKKLMTDLEAARTDEMVPRFNIRLMEDRLDRVCDRLRYQHKDVVEFVDETFSWKKGKKKGAIEEDRRLREEKRLADEEQERLDAVLKKLEKERRAREKAERAEAGEEGGEGDAENGELSQGYEEEENGYDFGDNEEDEEDDGGECKLFLSGSEDEDSDDDTFMTEFGGYTEPMDADEGDI